MSRFIAMAALPLAAGLAAQAGAAVAVREPSRLWSDHVVDYVICEIVDDDDGHGDAIRNGCDNGGRPLFAPEAEKVRQAIADWNARFGDRLRFRPVLSLRSNQRGVLFSRSASPTSCSTDRIGRPRLPRRTHVRIGARCNSFASASTPIHTITHEMLHVAGFYHEQQRPDRDAFVRPAMSQGLISRLLDLNGAKQWAKGSSNRTMRPLSDYDFGSIMHYPVRNSAKVKLTLQGMRHLEAQGLDLADPGKREALSDDDVAGFERLYARGARPGRIALAGPTAR